MFKEFLYDFDKYLIDNMYPIEIEDDDGEKRVTVFIDEGKSFEFNKRRIEKALNHFNSEEDSKYVCLASDFKLLDKDEMGIEISFDVVVMEKEKQVEKKDPKKNVIDSSNDEVKKFTIRWLDIDEKQAGNKDYKHVSTIHGKDAIEVLNKLGAALAVKGKNPRFIWIDKIQTPIKNYIMSGDLEHLLTKESIEE